MPDISPPPPPRPAARPGRLPGQLLRFAAIGVTSTLAYLVLYLALRPIGAQPANAIALLVTALANTAANRRFTFGTRGAERAVRHQVQGLVVFLIGLGVTSGALALVHLAVAEPPRPVELAALVVANALATVIRFVLLRGWVFRPAVEPAAPAARGTVVLERISS